ncbi:MAG: hypothetical protein Q4C86_14615 [bacterium]|nr:hypothetical protein [bacterium]
MIKFINLQFFKGGSSVQEVEKREPKSDQLKAMDDAVYGLMGGLMQRYGGVSMPNIASYAGSSGGSFGSSGYSGGSNRLTDQQAALLQLRSEGGPFAFGNLGQKYSGIWTDDRGNRYYNGKLVRTDEYGMSYVGNANNKQYVNLGSGMTGNNGGGGAGGSSYAAGYDNSGWGANGYLTQAFDTADALTNAANENSARLLQEVPAYLRKSDDMLGLAQNYADIGAKQSQKYYGDADEYLASHKGLLANGTDEGLQNVVNEMNRSVYSGMQKTAGAKLSDWAKKGIINSSVATSGIGDIENAAANAAAGNYGSAYNTMLQNYLGGAASARDNYNSGLSGLKTFADLPQQYYGNALAPLAPAYDYWKDSTNAWLANDKDYVATSDGGS